MGRLVVLLAGLAACATPRLPRGLLDELSRLPPVVEWAPPAQPSPDDGPEGDVTPHYLDLLERSASHAEEHDGRLWGDNLLLMLAGRSWPRTQPLLERFALGPQPRLATFALTLLYEHEQAVAGPRAGELRERLKAIAVDRDRPASHRLTAFEALTKSDWPGRSAWYAAQFADPTLSALRYDDPVSCGFPRERAAGPDPMLPVVVPLAGSTDPIVRANAVEWLLQRSNEVAAVRALLPWLVDRDWATGWGRLWLIGEIGNHELREAIPGLLAVLDDVPRSELEATERQMAAIVLGQFHVGPAVPALRRLLAVETRADYQGPLARALAECGGVTDEEVAAAVEAYERHQMAHPGPLRGPMPPVSPIVLGEAIRELSPGTASLLIDRAGDLDEHQSTLARRLRHRVDASDSAPANADYVERLAWGELDATSVRLGLVKRAALRRTERARLERLARRNHAWAGLAAVILGDVELMKTVERRDSQEARALLRASARLVPGDR